MHSFIDDDDDDDDDDDGDSRCQIAMLYLRAVQLPRLSRDRVESRYYHKFPSDRLEGN
jgi:hypothetical protein